MQSGTTVSPQEAGCHHYARVVARHTASVTVGEDTYNDTKVVTGEALGHAYGDPVFDWADDFSSCMASITCGVCKDGTEGKTLSSACHVDSQMFEPTCTANGKIVYTAKVTMEDALYSDVQEKPLTAPGHAWVSWQTISVREHSRSCTVCKTVETTRHTWKDHTCTNCM